MSIPDKQRVRDLLFNWRAWARDCPPDAAEVCFYTVSPMFQAITAQGSSEPYDNDAALMVEEVLREMFIPYRTEYRVLQAYYGESMTLHDIGQELGISKQAVHQGRLPTAERIFAEQWAELIRL